MKIKRIKLENNIYFGNITFDFTNENGEIMDNIILAGENGCGKTQLLNILYDFSEISTRGTVTDEKRIFTIFLSNDEINKLQNLTITLNPPTVEFEITQDFTVQPNTWGRIKINYFSIDENNTVITNSLGYSQLFSNVAVKDLFKSVFSTVNSSNSNLAISPSSGSFASSFASLICSRNAFFSLRDNWLDIFYREKITKIFLNIV